MADFRVTSLGALTEISGSGIQVTTAGTNIEVQGKGISVTTLGANLEIQARGVNTTSIALLLELGDIPGSAVFSQYVVETVLNSEEPLQISQDVTEVILGEDLVPLVMSQYVTEVIIGFPKYGYTSNVAISFDTSASIAFTNSIANYYDSSSPMGYLNGGKI